MSLQDIKQVLSKIISLNKNLDENRLNNLLEAGGWEKQNKEDALNLFKTEQKKNNKNLIAEEHREITTEVLDKELSVVENKQPSININQQSLVNGGEAKKEITMNFIPANLPIKEEDRQEIFLANNKPTELPKVEESVKVVHEKPLEAENVVSENNNVEKIKINWVPILAILLIIFLVAFGYLYSHGILK